MNFVTAGILHCFFEGYFITHHDRMGSTQDTLGQLWKEYAKSDSRYLVSDSFVVSIEFITVVSLLARCSGQKKGKEKKRKETKQDPLMIRIFLIHLNFVALVGASLSSSGALDHRQPPVEASAAHHYMHGPSVRRCLVLCH